MESLNGSSRPVYRHGIRRAIDPPGLVRERVPSVTFEGGRRHRRPLRLRADTRGVTVLVTIAHVHLARGRLHGRLHTYLLDARVTEDR